MKKNLTEIVFILDESGSMSPLTADTIGGFNSLIAKQKKEEGEAIVSTVFFNSRSKVVHDRLPLEKIGELTDREYCPAGSTALLDAVGAAVKHIGNIHKYARDEDIPEHTLFVITTDGMENSSRHYPASKVKQMINRQKEKYGWEFIFLGANIDAAETAESMGISRETAVDYSADCMGTEMLYSAVSCAVSNTRAGNDLRSEPVWRKELDEDNAKRRKRIFR